MGAGNPGLASTVWGISEPLGGGFNPATPGDIGLTTPAKAEFTNVGVGQAPDGTVGDISATGDVHAENGFFLGILTGIEHVWTNPILVSQLPPVGPQIGWMIRVTDALSPAWGVAVVGGGSAPALVWSNGTNWTVVAM